MHACRADPQLQLTGVPTLVHWTAEGPGERLGPKLERAGSPAVAFALAYEFMSLLLPKAQQ